MSSAEGAGGSTVKAKETAKVSDSPANIKLANGIETALRKGSTTEEQVKFSLSYIMGLVRAADREKRFYNTSPVDYRFEVEKLDPFFPDEAFVKYKAKVEVAVAQTFADMGLISQKSADAIAKAASEITAAEVSEEEDKTHHDIIALVNVIKKHMTCDEDKACVHRAVTSYDIVDTANVMRVRDAFNEVIIPDLISLLNTWADMAIAEKDTKQIGRTHLQHAEPITFGFEMAWYTSRLCYSILKIKEAVDDLKGKCSGAVGAYNAPSMFVDKPKEFEHKVLEKVGLEPAEISSQIVPPEPMATLRHHVIQAFIVLAQFSDDMRILEMPELGEIGQPRGADVSRSSTMPHKANPSGLENTISLYKKVMPTIITAYLDSLSNFQRDLTNSASERFTTEDFEIFEFSVIRTKRISTGMKTHPENMLRNLKMNADKILAEPIYLALSSVGHPEAHSYVGKLADEAYVSGKLLTQLVLEDESLKPYVQKFNEKQMTILRNPLEYLGIAPEDTEEVASACKQRMVELSARLRTSPTSIV